MFFLIVYENLLSKLKKVKKMSLVQIFKLSNVYRIYIIKKIIFMQKSTQNKEFIKSFTIKHII